jgi:hypothetical protein
VEAVRLIGDAVEGRLRPPFPSFKEIFMPKIVQDPHMHDVINGVRFTRLDDGRSVSDGELSDDVVTQFLSVSGYALLEQGTVPAASQPAPEAPATPVVAPQVAEAEPEAPAAPAVEPEAAPAPDVELDQPAALEPEAEAPAVEAEEQAAPAPAPAPRAGKGKATAKAPAASVVPPEDDTVF